MSGTVTVGYALCGSFCTIGRSLKAMRALKDEGYRIVPIVSESVLHTDTRFAVAADNIAEIESICGSAVIKSVREAEPLGPTAPLDLLIIAPCTGNTLAKLANGITDTAVTMAAKAHLRCDRPLLIALASNDALSQNLKNLSTLLTRKSVFFTPMRQDDPAGKPHSLVAELEQVPECARLALSGIQKKPLFLL